MTLVQLVVQSRSTLGEYEKVVRRQNTPLLVGLVRLWVARVGMCLSLKPQ